MYNFLAISSTSSILLVLIFIFISFFCLFLFVENYKLKEKIKQLELENKNLLETKLSKQKNVDSVSINKISTYEIKNVNNNQPKKVELVNKQIVKESVKQQEKQTVNTPKENPIKKQEPRKAYQKNVLHDKPNITSSVSLTKAEDDFDLNEFIKTNELKVKKTSEKEENIKEILDSLDKPNIKITNNKKSSNIDYLQEISNKMADELKPQTIELTDYEKIQEENAIISYKELITLKDQIMMLDDDDETVNFIEELKKLRNSLK